MVHDSTSRAAARDLLAESDVVPSDELTETLAELKILGEQPAPPISPALAEALRQAASAAGQPSSGRRGVADNVVTLRSRKARRRGAAMGGAVVLAMAAGMGGVAAFGPGDAVGSAMDTVIRWVAPTERTEPASEERPAPVEPASVPVPDVAPASEAPASVPSQAAPELTRPSEPALPEAPAKSAAPTPATRKGQPTEAGNPGRGAVTPVELPELPAPLPDPVPTPRSVLPVDPPQLPLPGGVPAPVPSADPPR